MEVDRLVLEVVILQAERVPGVDVQNLADVALGLRPMKLVAPRLLDSRDDVVHSLALAAHFVLCDLVAEILLDLFDRSERQHPRGDARHLSRARLLHDAPRHRNARPASC